MGATKIMELKSAIKKLEQLPEDERKPFASVLEELLMADKKWDALFAMSSDLLASMASAAINEYERAEYCRLMICWARISKIVYDQAILETIQTASRPLDICRIS